MGQSSLHTVNFWDGEAALSVDSTPSHPRAPLTPGRSSYCCVLLEHMIALHQTAATSVRGFETETDSGYFCMPETSQHAGGHEKGQVAKLHLLCNPRHSQNLPAIKQATSKSGMNRKRVHSCWCLDRLHSTCHMSPAVRVLCVEVHSLECSPAWMKALG